MRRTIVFPSRLCLVLFLQSSGTTNSLASLAHSKSLVNVPTTFCVGACRARGFCSSDRFGLAGEARANRQIWRSGIVLQARNSKQEIGPVGTGIVSKLKLLFSKVRRRSNLSKTKGDGSLATMTTGETDQLSNHGGASNGSAKGEKDEIDLTKALSQLSLSKLQKFTREGGDVLFGYIEQSQLEYCSSSSTASSEEDASFGTFLDAGTGSHSLRWMASILHRKQLAALSSSTPRRVSMSSYTAITADETMRRNVLQEAQELGVDQQGDIIIGNWFPNNDDDNANNTKNHLLEGRVYDTILADYLIGAMDGFSPYRQDLMLDRLLPHLSPDGGRLYIIGLQPIPDKVYGDANIMCKITKVRDACILLANHRCYREYPLDWILRLIQKTDGLHIVETKKYPIRYDHSTMVRQINVARSKLRLFPSQSLANEMKKTLDDLEKESLEITQRQSNKRITLGFDYVVVAQRGTKILPHDDI